MSKDHDDDILRKVEETLKGSEQTRTQSEKSDSIREELNKPSLSERIFSITLAAKRINKVYEAAKSLYDAVSKVAGPLLKPAAWVGGKLKDAFMWSAFEHEKGQLKLDEDGDPIFSGKRLRNVFAGAAGAILALHMGLSGAYFYGTQFSETVYVTGKQEIVAGELYQFTGCTSLPCATDTDNGKYYHIEHSLIFPHLMYPEEDVYANIPQQNAACHVEGYGIYFKELKPLFRWAEWYQNVYSVSCRPYTNAEIQQSVDSGIIQPAPMPAGP